MNTRLMRCGFALTAAVLLVCSLLALLSMPGRSSAAVLRPQPAVSFPSSVSHLGDANFANAPFGTAPSVDGRISPGEYADAYKLSFPTYGGSLEAFIVHTAMTLYIAFDSPDTTAYPFLSGGGPGPAMQVFLDTQNDKAAAPKPDDYRLTLAKNGGLQERSGNGVDWSNLGDGNWTAMATATPWGWQGEFEIGLAKLGITQTGPISVGLALAEVWTPSWPQDW